MLVLVCLQVIVVLVLLLINVVFIEMFFGICDYLVGVGYQFLIGEIGYVWVKEEQLIVIYLVYVFVGFLFFSSEQYDILQVCFGSWDILVVCMFDLGCSQYDFLVGFLQICVGYVVVWYLVECGYWCLVFFVVQLDLCMMKCCEGFCKGLLEVGIKFEIEVLLFELIIVDMGV